MTDHPYNNIYQELVRDNGDAVGIFAYALYKQHKIAFINRIIIDEDRNPTTDELSNFHRSSMTQQAISGYRIQGEALVLAFLNESLAQRVRDIENGVQDSVIGEHLKNIKDQIDSKKTWLGWGKDVLNNLSVNILTIIVIGSIIIGYNYLSGFYSKTETAAGITNQSK
jgi:hypothetical protein